MSITGTIARMSDGADVAFSMVDCGAIVASVDRGRTFRSVFVVDGNRIVSDFSIERWAPLPRRRSKAEDTLLSARLDHDRAVLLAAGFDADRVELHR